VNPRLFLKLFYACTLIAIPLGYLHLVWWLIVPPLVFGAYYFASVARADAYLMQYGEGSLRPSMFFPNIVATIRGSVIPTGIFFVAWGVSLFFSGGNG
jgi:hypothetical protein